MYRWQCNDFDYPEMEECRDDLSSTDSNICYCEKCKDFFKSRSDKLNEHLKNCTKCISWKDIICNNGSCPNEIKCVLTECPNFEICSNKYPGQLMDCWGGRCIDCDMVYFENLTIEEKNEFCPICQEQKIDRFVSWPKCPLHFFCLNCFKTLEETRYTYKCVMCRKETTYDKSDRRN